MGRFADLHDGLVNSGWEVAQCDIPPLIWRAWQIWRLVSLRTPQGCEIYLSLCAAPDFTTWQDAAAPEAGDVRCIVLTSEFPDETLDEREFAVWFGRHPSKEFAKVVEAAAALRASKLS